MPTFHQVKSFIRHWLNEEDDHSIHSPFFFDLYTKIVAKKNKSDIPVLENLRRDLEGNKTVLNVEDFGSGARENSTRTIREIARTSLTSYKVALFYLDLLYFIDANRVVGHGRSDPLSVPAECREQLLGEAARLAMVRERLRRLL